MGLNNCKDALPGEYFEGFVCNEDDIPENGMKVFDFGPSEGGKVLMVKQKGRISALGTKCSHYGAPLVTGALGSGRIRCPWHGACFSLASGDIEDFPGLDSIPCYNVEVLDHGKVKVRAKMTDLKANKRMKCMAKRDPKNQNTYVIIGAGAAGLVCAETLRQEGFTGRVVMISAESFYPYDRIKLSKMLDALPENITLRHEAFYTEHDIELMLNTKANQVDTEQKIVKLNNGSSLNYNALFVSTGNVPRKLELGGQELKNVFTLRNLNDAHEINNSLSPSVDVVIYGSSFIGMEVAAFCCGKAKSVTVVGRSSLPFKESLGKILGERIAQLFKEKGVVLKLGLTVESLEGSTEGKVTGVVLSNTAKLPADVVVIGLGSKPATEFLPPTINRNPNGTIPVSERMATSAEGVWAGGDIVEAPVLDERASIGHWGLAHYHGRVAALNMLSKAVSVRAVPFFWTVLFGTSFRYAGFTRGFDEELVVGEVDKLKCAVYYCRGEKVVAVATVAFDPVAAQFAELLSRGSTLTKEQVNLHPTDWWKELSNK